MLFRSAQTSRWFPGAARSRKNRKTNLGQGLGSPKVKTRRAKLFSQGLRMLGQRWGGRAKGQVDNAGGRVNCLELAVTSWAGPEPCSHWSRLWVQGGWAWCEGTWRSPRGGSSRASPGAGWEQSPSSLAFPLQALFLACGIHSFYNAFIPCVRACVFRTSLAGLKFQHALLQYKTE